MSRFWQISFVGPLGLGVLLEWLKCYLLWRVSSISYGDSIFGGTQTGSYQTGSYQKGRFIPPKPKLSYVLLFDTTPFICLWYLFSPGAGLRRNPFVHRWWLRFSRGWLRKDGNLLTETGCTSFPRYICIYIYIYIYKRGT